MTCLPIIINSWIRKAIGFGIYLPVCWFRGITAHQLINYWPTPSRGTRISLPINGENAKQKVISEIEFPHKTVILQVYFTVK